MKTTSVHKRNSKAFDEGYRRIVNIGGTSSGKTFSILQLLLSIATRENNVSISVVSETLPHLKLGAIKDFETILKADDIYNTVNINQTEHRYYFNDSYIEFFSADQPGKVTGPRRDILYFNEVINIPYSVVEAAEIRTNDTIFYDFNPYYNFWITDKVMALPDSEVKIIKSNYLDNEYLNVKVKKDIELRAAHDPAFKKVHIDVEFGRQEGLIFTNWRLCDYLPQTDKRSLGMDFGFTNDPTTLIEVRLQDGELWVNEIIYEKGLTNLDIAGYIKAEELQSRMIIADAAEPKSIEELHRMGIKIKAATKGSDSIRQGLNALQRYRINITKGSINTIKEFRNYKWKQDKNGEFLNEPIDHSNHSLDAIRYSMEAFGKQITAAKYSF